MFPATKGRLNEHISHKTQPHDHICFPVRGEEYSEEHRQIVTLLVRVTVRSLAVL